MSPEEIRAAVDELHQRTNPDGSINATHVAAEQSLRDRHGHPGYIARLDGPGRFRTVSRIDVYRVYDRPSPLLNGVAKWCVRHGVRVVAGRCTGPWWAVAVARSLAPIRRATSPRGRWQAEWDGCQWCPRAITRRAALRVARRHSADPDLHAEWAAQQRAGRDAREAAVAARVGRLAGLWGAYADADIPTLDPITKEPR